MDLHEMEEWVARCTFPDYTFAVWRDPRGTIYLQARYAEPDALTGVKAVQQTRRWLLSPAMTPSEIVQTVFKCALTSMEHRTREFFRYQGRAIFGPHFAVDALWDLCGQGRLDGRPAPDGGEVTP